MIKRILLILSLLIVSQFNSQIKIEINVDNDNKKASVTFINTSNDNVVIPLDTSSLRPYFDDICLDLAQHTYRYPTLGLNIKTMENNKVVESLAGSGKTNDLRELKKELKGPNLEKKKFEKSLKSWQKKNSIKSFDDAKINYYIFNNLVYLKPGEKIEKVFYFDLHNITNGKYMYYYYHIEEGKQYDVSLTFNVNECVYKYLTKNQKDRLKGYKLFTGSLESNKIELKE